LREKERNLKHKKLDEEEVRAVDAILEFWFPPKGWDRHTSKSAESIRLHSNPKEQLHGIKTKFMDLMYLV
jgi:hypothetical protein